MWVKRSTLLVVNIIFSGMGSNIKSTIDNLDLLSHLKFNMNEEINCNLIMKVFSHNQCLEYNSGIVSANIEIDTQWFA